MDTLYSFVAHSGVLSTTEAEYVAVSEVVKEIKFLYQLLMSMGC